MNMLEQIRKDGNLQKYVNRAKDKNDKFRLMGFGHRVYKNFDPRATIIKSACDRLLEKMDIDDPLFEIAQELEQVALNDEYFVERRLSENLHGAAADFDVSQLCTIRGHGVSRIARDTQFRFTPDNRRWPVGGTCLATAAHQTQLIGRQRKSCTHRAGPLIQVDISDRHSLRPRGCGITHPSQRRGEPLQISADREGAR